MGVARSNIAERAKQCTFRAGGRPPLTNAGSKFDVATAGSNFREAKRVILIVNAALKPKALDKPDHFNRMLRLRTTPLMFVYKQWRHLPRRLEAEAAD